MRVLHGGGEVGRAVVESSVGKIFFTGSVATGYSVGEACAARMKGAVLELGGKDPAIVCADADLDNAIDGISVWGGFANAGQTCWGSSASTSSRDVADRFVAGIGRGGRAARPRRSAELGRPRSARWSRPSRPPSSTSWSTTRSRPGAERICGGPAEVAGIARQPHRADGPDRRHPRDADHARGDLRPGPADRRRRRRGRGPAPGERLRLRSRGIDLDPQPAEGRADGAAPRVRDGLDQRPRLHPRGRAVRLGRRQGLRPRPLALAVRLLRVRRGSRPSPGTRPAAATSGGIPTTRPSAGRSALERRPPLRRRRPEGQGPSRRWRVAAEDRRANVRGR